MLCRCFGALVVMTGLVAIALADGEGTPPMAGDTPAVAEEKPAAEEKAAVAEEKPAAEERPAVEAGPAGEFQKIFTEWKGLLAELGALQVQYKQADAARRREIEKQWGELMTKAETMKDDLKAAAEKAYLASPNTDKQIVELLVGMVASSLRWDDYEEALRLARLLLDNKCDEKTLPNMAGTAAFHAGEFDAAEQYFDRARSLNAIDMNSRDLAKQVPEYKQLWAKEQEIRAAEAKAGDLPRVLLKTTKGDIEIELFENEAPNTAANFVSLVEKGFYNGLSFHRVLPGFMAQGGDPKGDGTGGPGYHIACECYRPDYRHHFRGTLSMAHAGRDTGGSQFFLTFVPTSHLDGKHTAFGRVVKGMDVLAKLQRRDPQAANPPKPDKIIEAKVLKKRDHEYVPKTTAELEP